MSKIGTTPVAARYDGLATGSGFTYLFQTQTGVPVDGTNAGIRDMSPFVLRLVVPDALLEMSTTQDNSVNLIQTAMLGARTSANNVASALSRVTATGTGPNPTGQLESFVSAGQFFTASNATFVSSIADAYTAADIALQVNRILNAPPLTLLVNPTDMTIQYTKIQSHQSKTRSSYVYEAWGEDMSTISFTGTTGGFIAGALNAESPYGAQEVGQTTSPSGYQWASRLDSAAWQNFASLVQFYKNNGYIYDTVGKSGAHLFVGSVAIDYDQWTYQGHIESFNYRFDEGSPTKVTFDMEFKVDRTFDRSQSSSVVQPMNSPLVSSNLRDSNPVVFSPASGISITAGDIEFSSTPIDLLGGT